MILTPFQTYSLGKKKVFIRVSLLNLKYIYIALRMFQYFSKIMGLIPRKHLEVTLDEKHLPKCKCFTLKCHKLTAL